MLIPAKLNQCIITQSCVRVISTIYSHAHNVKAFCTPHSQNCLSNQIHMLLTHRSSINHCSTTLLHLVVEHSTQTQPDRGIYVPLPYTVGVSAMMLIPGDWLYMYRFYIDQHLVDTYNNSLPVAIATIVFKTLTCPNTLLPMSSPVVVHLFPFGDCMISPKPITIPYMTIWWVMCSELALLYAVYLLRVSKSNFLTCRCWWCHCFPPTQVEESKEGDSWGAQPHAHLVVC